MAATQRITIGFQGGPVLPVRVGADALEKLRAALSSGDWHELATDDGTVTLNLSQVIYLNVDAEDQRVGFS